MKLLHDLCFDHNLTDPVPGIVYLDHAQTSTLQVLPVQSFRPLHTSVDSHHVQVLYRHELGRTLLRHNPFVDYHARVSWLHRLAKLCEYLDVLLL